MPTVSKVKVASYFLAKVQFDLPLVTQKQKLKEGFCLTMLRACNYSLLKQFGNNSYAPLPENINSVGHKKKRASFHEAMEVALMQASGRGSHPQLMKGVHENYRFRSMSSCCPPINSKGLSFDVQKFLNPVNYMALVLGVLKHTVFYGFDRCMTSGGIPSIVCKSVIETLVWVVLVLPRIAALPLGLTNKMSQFLRESTLHDAAFERMQEPNPGVKQQTVRRTAHCIVRLQFVASAIYTLMVLALSAYTFLASMDPFLQFSDSQVFTWLDQWVKPTPLQRYMQVTSAVTFLSLFLGIARALTTPQSNLRRGCGEKMAQELFDGDLTEGLAGDGLNEVKAGDDTVEPESEPGWLETLGILARRRRSGVPYPEEIGVDNPLFKKPATRV